MSAVEAQRAAPRPTGGRARTRTGGGVSLWLLGLACGAVATIASGAALLLAVLLAPCGVALLLDMRAARPPVRALAMAGLAAAVGPLLTLWHAGGQLAAALGILADLRAVATAWSVQAAVWLVGETLPLAIRLALDARAAARAAHLRAEREKLAAQWEVFPGSPPGR